MKLNISQEMLDKLKRLKGKIALFTAATATVIGLAGCTNTDAITLPSDAPITSEMPSSEVPSSSEEMPSEEVSEELPSEEVNEEYYSAEEVMTLVNDLTAKYTYDNPEFIKALVIAANLDYITAADLDVLLDTYGYSMEDLNAIYNSKDGIISVGMAYETSKMIFQGSYIEYDETKDYSKRINLSEVMLNEKDRNLAVEFEKTSSTYDLSNFDIENPTTSGEVTVNSFLHLYRWGQLAQNTYSLCAGQYSK